MTLSSNTNPKRIVIVSDPKKRIDLINWAYENRQRLKKHQIFAPWSTASILEGTLNCYVYKLPELEAGGEKVVGRMMTNGEADFIFVLSEAQAYVSDKDAMPWLLMQAVSLNIPFACNISTADIVVASLSSVSDEEKAENLIYLNPKTEYKEARHVV